MPQHKLNLIVDVYDYFDSHHEDIFETIRSTKDLPEEAVLNEAIQAFKDQSEYK